MSDSIARVPGGVLADNGGQPTSDATYAPPADAGDDEWVGRLQAASWRGLPFGVDSSEYGRGRRFAVHEYPKRDLPWPEDMGRATRTTSFSGFVVGDDCYQQAQDLLNAAEAYGAGQLVHPSLGEFWAAMVSPLVAVERKERGRVVELRFEVIEAGQPLYPADTISTQTEVQQKADDADKASKAGFANATKTSAASTSSSKTGSAGASTGGAAAPSQSPSPNDVGGSISYTDSSGTTTELPAESRGYQQPDASRTIGDFGDAASKQGSDPAVAAAPPPINPPREDTTYGRFDPQAGATAGQTDQQARDEQVQERNEINDNAEKAARADLIS